MPYQSSSFDDVVPLLKRTVFGTIDFSGRSRVTEFIYYWVAVIILRSLTVVMLPYTSVSFGTVSRVGVGLSVLLAVPMFALFVRRLHDQDRPGWWAAALPISLLLTAPAMIAQWNGDLDAILERQYPMADMAGLIVGIAAFILCFLPGTEGPNQYGPDPRLEEE